MSVNKEYSLYYRSTNPNLSQVFALTDKLYQWDGTSSMPTEVAQNKGAMPPTWGLGHYVIWSDTYTLGFTDEANAAPMFFTDLGIGDARILRVINHVAKKLNVSEFTDVTAAKTWAENESRIWVNVMTDDNVGICVPYQVQVSSSSVISYVPCGSTSGALEQISVLPVINGGQAVNFSGQNAYPAIQSINLGQSVGNTLLTYDAYGVPDRFVVYYDNKVAIDTGYRGEASYYNIGGANRSAFNASLTGKQDPVTGGTYPLSTSIAGIQSDGYPEVIAPGRGSITFNKNLANVTSADIKVYAPMSGTAWELTMGLPNGESSVVGGGTGTNTVNISVDGSGGAPTVVSGSAIITKL